VKYKIVLKNILPLFFISFSVFAGTNNWYYSNYSYGSYVPKSGTFTESVYIGQYGPTYQSKVEFGFDSTNLTSILDYNNGGDNPGTTCDNANAYVTVDMTAVANNTWGEKLDAYQVISTLPTPKYDLESDAFSSSYNEESETVALGTIQAYRYYTMTTYRKDWRIGGTNDGGKIQVQFAMSKKGISDYNNCTTAGAVQIINPYGNTQASY
jgi:hypothetical protein